MDIINKRKKVSETLQFKEGRQNIRKRGNHRLIFDSNSIKKIWVPKRLDKRRRGNVAAIDSELLFRNNEKKRWDGGYFEINEPRASSSTEQNKIEREIVSSTEDYDNNEKSYILFESTTLLKSQKRKKSEAEKYLKRAELDFMVDSKTSILKTSVDLKLLSLKICVRNLQKGSVPEEIFPVFNEIIE